MTRPEPVRPASPLTDAFFELHGSGERYGIINGTEFDYGYETVKDQKAAGAKIPKKLQAEFDALTEYQNAMTDYLAGHDLPPVEAPEPTPPVAPETSLEPIPAPELPPAVVVPAEPVVLQPETHSRISKLLNQLRSLGQGYVGHQILDEVATLLGHDTPT
jgi:hypothetical protein